MEVKRKYKLYSPQPPLSPVQHDSDLCYLKSWELNNLRTQFRNIPLNRYSKQFCISNITSSQSGALCQDLLQLLGSSASDEGSDQGQRVRVEVGLRQETDYDPQPGPSYRGHEGVQDTHSEGSSTGEGLGEVKLSVRVVIIIVRIDELDVAVVDQLGDHGDAGPEAGSPALEDDRLAEWTGAVAGGGIWKDSRQSLTNLKLSKYFSGER